MVLAEILECNSQKPGGDKPRNYEIIFVGVRFILTRNNFIIGFESIRSYLDEGNRF